MKINLFSNIVSSTRILASNDSASLMTSHHVKIMTLHDVENKKYLWSLHLTLVKPNVMQKLDGTNNPTKNLEP